MKPSSNSFSVPSAEPIHWEPLPYMLKAVQWLLQHGAAGLFFDPGLRKTSISLAAIKALKEAGTLPEGMGFLVIAPLRPVYQVWPAEIVKWAEFTGLTYAILHGPKKDAELRRRVDLHLINPDGLEWLFKHLGGRWPWYGLIVDESHMFKHSNTSRFKLLRMFLPRFRRRYILTGSPAPNGLLDLFGQLYLLDLGAALGAFISHYRRAYFAPTGYGGYTWVPQRDAEQKIYARIEPLILRASEADHLSLPPLIGNFNNPKHPPSLVKVTLPPKARKVYDQLEKLFFAELEEGSVTAANAGVRSIKLRQAANGGLYLDRGDEAADDVKVPGATRRWALLHDAKTEAVAELLGELSGKPALIAYEFHHDLERLRRHRDLRNVPALGSGNTRKEDAALEAAWNRGELSALLGNPQSMAHGLNLQGGRVGIFHSLTWRWDDYWQFIKRFYRSGQRHRCFVHHVVAVDTVDEAMGAVLAGKGRTEGALLRALREYSHRRPT